VNADGLREITGDLLLTLVIAALFVALFLGHQVDMRRRRRRAAAVRATADYGPYAEAIVALVAAAGTLDARLAPRLAAERRQAFDWDPRLEKIPKVARTARDRAFANLRDDVARAAAEAAREAAAGALAAAAIEPRIRLEAAECAAETAGAMAAAARLPAAEFRMLTRAWRSVVGPIGVSPRRDP
jgi:hypothetical protein